MKKKVLYLKHYKHFLKQEKIPERNLVDFKPTSISQIATSSDSKQQNMYEREPLESSETEEGKELGDVKKDLDNSSADGDDTTNNVDIESSLQESQQERE